MQAFSKTEQRAYLAQFYSQHQIDRFCAGSDERLHELFEETQPKDMLIEELFDVNDGVRYLCDSPDGWVPVDQWRNKGIKPTSSVLLDNGATATTSNDHLFQAEDESWVYTADLKTGDRLLTLDGASTVIQVESTGAATVYDLAIGHKNHRYYTNKICSHNSGKSLFLQNLAVNWSMMGYIVLYISLELSEDLVAIRLDAMITGRGTSEVLRDIPGTVMLIRNTQRTEKPGRIYVKRLPEGGTNTNTIRAYIKEFEVQTGLKPDALVIDYLDLVYSNNGKLDPSDQFIKDKYVSEEIRGLMDETNTFGATASQLNRGAVDAEDYNHSHIGGGISKINTADNVLGIRSSMAMKERGQYILQFLKTRSSSAVGQSIDLGYNVTSMRITNALVAVEDTDAPLSKPELRKKLGQIAAPSDAPVADPSPAATLASSKIDRLRDKASGVV